MKYDYLIVGSGFFGAVFAHEAHKAGKSVIVIEKRPEIGGNARTEEINGINVHLYGPHIFHTKDVEIWDYINKFADFNNIILSPIANYNGELYNLPFNMNTFAKILSATTADEATKRIEETKFTGIPSNLEEQALSMVGKDIYEKLVKEYTEKQWGRDCKDLPTFIIKRLPVRYSFNNNYFNDRYQGIPIGGYSKIFQKLLAGIEVMTGVDYFENKDYFNSLADKIVYTGEIDKFFDYKYGKLDYRSLRFEHEVLDTSNYQGCAVMNFTSKNEKFTRIIEHKHFENLTNEAIYSNDKTVITKEYPEEFKTGGEPYYPINDDKNNTLLQKYKEEAEKLDNMIFGGRLGEYKYYDMDQVIKSALKYWR